MNQRVPINDRLYTVPEAALRLTVKPNTVRDWVLKQRIGIIHVGSAVRIPESKILRILAAGWIPAAQKVWNR